MSPSLSTRDGFLFARSLPVRIKYKQTFGELFSFDYRRTSQMRTLVPLILTIFSG
jgi:hypothetical protein